MSSSSSRAGLLSGLILASVTLAGVTGCKPGAQTGANPAAASALPVGIFTVQAEPVLLTRELPGRTSASQVAEVRARVSGIVLERRFEEGSLVQAGDLLYTIDPEPYEATLASALATLARARANLNAAELQAERYKSLVASDAISKQTFDNAEAARLAGRAEVAAAEAAVKTAEINLGYTRVTAPINGRIGRAEVTVGAYVQQGTATLLATIQTLDPLYVDLSQSAEEVLALRRAVEAGTLSTSVDGAASFSVTLSDGRTLAQSGTLQFSDVTVNQTTATVLLRGTIPNPDQSLLPGLFVRAKLVEGQLAAGLLVPQSLVSRNNRGEATTLVVNAENKIEARVLATDRAIGNRWLIKSGLQVGDRLLADNLQKVRPGMTVAPQAAAAAAAPTPAPATH